MKKERLKGLLVVFTIFGLILVGKTSFVLAETKTVRIGLILPLTGPMAPFAELCKRGHDIALELWNEKGGFKSLGGAKAEYVYADAQSDVQTGRTETEKLIINEKVIALLGAYSSSITFGATEIAERYSIPFVVESGVADQITKRGFKTPFRFCVNSTQFSGLGWDILRDVILPRAKGKLMVGVIVENTLMGTSMAQGYKKFIENEPRTTLALYELYDPKSSDLSPVVLKIKSAKPDVLLLSQYISDAILLNNQMYELGASVMARVGLGAGYTIPELIKGCGKNVEGVFSGTTWNYDASEKGYPGTKEYVRRYQKKHGELPEQHSALSIGASWVLFDAIERAGSTNGDEITKALRETNLLTVCGAAKFDKYGDNILASRMAMQIQNGKFVTVWPEAAAQAKPIFPAWGPKK